jgi:hypothetical protein
MPKKVEGPWNPLALAREGEKQVFMMFLATVAATYWCYANLDFTTAEVEDKLWFFMRADVCVILVSLYHLSKDAFSWLRPKLGLIADNKNPGKLVDNTAKRLFDNAVILHNLILCVFSAWIMLKTWPMVPEYFRGDFKNHRAFWDDGFGGWAIIFYVSKFYEFVDSWVLVLKSKNPSFLQVYHHTGVVYCMYFGCVSRATWLINIVCLNSFIHTLMYFLYASTSFVYYDPRSVIKTTITKMQISQFMLGITVASLFYWNPEATIDQLVGLGMIQVYAMYLIKLFGDMAKAKYKKP